ncbi:MAG: dienelactone hydrolase family protein [Ignavibacteria bacterium]|nr:dienelactone hydrolase family protein [Ignavibacteria bacterium]MBT8382833.1 dienelactone hydrolase family protein [Ignavibacteria bacterium]MBT8390433.1 dienelactone hydrolase family protein [Ignavibacteria bacterium]NNJ51966.1 dienelactone hydrolase family protein [Ignavibacteriaceae bacterium]NNL20762.1 dienelactone hydrolase family protein [Ignavibacteriaceae bacterium]
MFKLLSLIAIVIITLSCTEKQDEKVGLVEQDIVYTSDGTSMKGYLVYNGDVDGERPGVLVVHEWWGHNDYARKRARMLAELGYTALAVDMYGDGKQADHPDDAGKFAMEIYNNIETAEARFNAAYELLKKHETTGQDKIAAIGYCFGGGVVLHMARIGTDLDAVVSFHGSIQAVSPAEKDKVNAFLLVCNGADDPMVTEEQIAAFKEEMQNANVDYEFINYESAKHSFTNPIADSVGQQFGLPLAYNEKADKDSWEKMKALFNKVFAEN